MSATGLGDPSELGEPGDELGEESAPAPAPKKSRTNTPWSAAEEQRLKVMREAGNTWGEIAKVRWSHYRQVAAHADEWADIPKQNRRKCEKALV